jgi:hypothetical protein
MADALIPDPPIIGALNPVCQKFARDYLDAFPVGSSFTSGRRSIDDQARADAQCVVESRAFIPNIYVPSPVRAAMVSICDANPYADAATLGPLFAACLGAFSDDALSHFSLHLSGNAVDCAPIGDPAREQWATQYVAAWIAAGGSARSKVLTRESGLSRLHVQIL